MPYATPFQFSIEPGRPLLVLSCSEMKAAVGEEQLVRFGELYTGPLWQQVKAAGYPMTNVAAVSALYGFLEPGFQIRTYDRKMDEKISRRICCEGNAPALFAQAVRTAGSAYVVGGKMYRELAETAMRMWPELVPQVTLAEGSFLQLRAQLGKWLKNNTIRPLDVCANAA